MSKKVAMLYAAAQTRDLDRRGNTSKAGVNGHPIVREWIADYRAATSAAPARTQACSPSTRRSKYQAETTGW
ncbi:MAG: hypothetical protein H7288_20060 [Kineosporiaceae bacterium]|nr:hypothetical protein [Aeromicrobium sp.]